MATMNELKWKHIREQLGAARGEAADLRQQLQAAEQRAAEAEAHLRAVLDDVEWIRGTIDDKCAWCGGLYHFDGHEPDCPRQAAAAWLEAGEGKERDDG